MEARATRMEETRRLLHLVEEEEREEDWVDRLLMRCPNWVDRLLMRCPNWVDRLLLRCPDNPIIFDPEFRCSCFTLFFGLVFIYWWVVWIIWKGKDSVFS